MISYNNTRNYQANHNHTNHKQNNNTKHNNNNNAITDIQ